MSVNLAKTTYIIPCPAHRERPVAIVPDRNRRRKHIEPARVFLPSAEAGPV
jgi:hypothetical protein